MPILAYAGEGSGALVRALRVYFVLGPNAREGPARLFLHRNSMLYRLARVEELTGLDLKDPGARLAIQLGLLFVGEKERSSKDEA